jgi:predicted enzyme related to lactoylglutathione lyase
MATRFLRSRTTLPVRDVPTSIDFYQRAVGFEVLVTMGDPPDFAIIGVDDTGLGLGQVDQPAVSPLACCYFDVDGVEALHQRCLDAGASVAAPLTRHPWGNYDFVIADPDGHLLAFGESPGPVPNDDEAPTA